MGVTEGDGPIALGVGHTIEMARPSVPAGIQDGNITRRLASFVVVGCTCGFYQEGFAAQVMEGYRTHIAEAG